MAMKTELDAAKEYVTALEAQVTETLTKEFGRRPNPSEIREHSEIVGHSIGRPYGPQKSLIDSQPGFVGKALSSVAGTVHNAVDAPARFAGRALAERTESLSDDESSLPTETFSFPSLGASRNAFNKGLNAVAELNPFEGQGGTRDPFYTPLQTDKPPPSFTVGPEFAADAIEIGGPAAAEVGLALARTNPTGFIVGTVLANVGSEVAAEYLRVLNRDASQLPSKIEGLDTPYGMFKHFSMVAVGGALLGSADLALTSGQIRTQRKLYNKVLGLGTTASKENVERIRFLTGGDANLAEATTTGISLIGHALKVLPLTAKKSIRRSRDVTEKMGKTLGDKISLLGDNLAAGVHFATVPSQAWQDANDLALQQARNKGNVAYTAAQGIAEEAEFKYGRDAVFIPHDSVRKDIDELILKATAGLPLVGKGTSRRVATGAIEKDPSFQLLNDVLDLDDKAGVVEYMALRNQLEAASEAAGGVNTQIGRVYGLTAMKMRAAIMGMNAPPEVKTAFEAATQTWSDMISFTQSPAWKQFRKADPQFGLPNKADGGRASTTAEVTLQNAMKDKDISPEIVKTWWRAAKEGGSESQFKGAVEMHFRLGFQDAKSVAERGPLAGTEMMDFRKFEKFLGADIPDSAKWAAHEEMIRKSGGNPKEIIRFLDNAKLAFPDGIPSPSTTAARRVGLAGMKSAVKFASGVGFVSGVGGGGVLGALGGGVASFLALLGTGQLFLNPAVLRRMSMIMEGGMTEQGAWRTLWNTAASMGLTRAFQDSLQAEGIDPLFTPTRAAQEERMLRLRSNIGSLDAAGSSGMFGKNPITGYSEYPEDTPQLVPQR